jgi:zinc protease
MTVKKFDLENGMQVLLEENRASPVISFNALVKVGSAFETDAEAGICHVIEHMLFKGTPTKPVGTIARDVEAAGGEINAYTSFDQTVFYINMATRFADRGLAILADAIQNPLFDENELSREQEVILEEIRREKDNPNHMISELLFKHAYTRHPYGRPIIGTPESVKSFTRKHLLDFYRRWYTPRNISLVVVGDFETEMMLEQIRRIFAHFEGPPPPIPALEALVEPPQKGLRVVTETMNIQSSYLAMGYHIPALIHPDIPQMDLLSHILGGTESSRLEQVVKEKKHLVHQISSFSYTPMDPGLFVVSAILEEKNILKALEATQKEIEIMQQDPVLVSELSRGKLNIRSNELYERETVGGEAGKLAMFLACAGTHEFERRYYQMLMDVSADMVREAAKRYLVPENCTIAVLLPRQSKLPKQKQKIAGAVSTPAEKEKKAVKKSHDSPQEYWLKNGVKVIVRENHNLPLVSMCATSLGGTRFEAVSNNGISELASRLLLKGTRRRDAITIAKDIEKIAGHMDGFSGRNTIGLRLEFISDHISSGVELFSDVLLHPAFSPAEVAKEKHLQIRAIKDQEDALPSLAFINFLALLFPKHPYGLRLLGTRDSVTRITPLTVKKFYSGLIKAPGLVVSVVGDVSPKEVNELLESHLADIPRGKIKRPLIPHDPPPREIRKTEILKKEKQQAHIVIGFRGTSFCSKDRYAMTVLNNILAGQGGRLFLELRDKMGLAYAVSSTNVEGIETGYFAVYIGTEKGKVDTAVSAIKKELGKIIDELVTKEELERSRQYLVGTYELESQRLMTLASWYAFNELYGLGIKEIERYPQKILSVTREEIQKAARKHIDLSAYVLSIIKPG